jgi:hypothetical protein
MSKKNVILTDLPRIIVLGALPKKTFWQRLRRLFNDEPEQVFCEFVLIDIQKGICEIRRLENLSSMMITVN